MGYKFSNIADKSVLENFAGIPLKFPEIYQPTPVITDFKETIVPIVTQDDLSSIDFGVWGLLSKNHNEDWQTSKNIFDTPTVIYDDAKNNFLQKNTTSLNRCVVLATGFFTLHLNDGEKIPYYVYQKNKKPFYIAAYYNRLEDGFITVVLLLKKAEPQLEKIVNNNQYIPKILNHSSKNQWLSKTIFQKKLDLLIPNTTPIRLNSHPVANELFKLNTSKDRILESL